MSYSISLTGLQNAQTDLNVIGNNIANADTNGFKSSTVQFADLVAANAYSNPRDTSGIGSSVASIDQDFSQGAIQQTGSGLDLAISGDGFFAVKSPTDNQVSYTRNGAFTFDSTTTAGSGYIVDDRGARLQVLATGGGGTTDAVVPTTDAGGSAFAGVTISNIGAVSASYADGTIVPIGTVALAAFASPQGLQQQGSTDYTATGISGAATYGQPGGTGLGSLQSGALEASNVDLSSAMVNLITAQQYFQANSKAIDATTTITQAVINLKD